MDILQLFCILGEQARKAWENLRDTFRRKLKTDTETKSGQGRSDIVKWPFFNTMMFLKDVMIPRESSGNLPLTYDENELSPSNLSNATLEDVDEENTNDTEADINCSIREPEASGSEFTSFAKPQSKQQPSSSLIIKMITIQFFQKNKNKIVMIPRCLKLKEGKLT